MLRIDWSSSSRAHRVVVREAAPDGFVAPRYVDAFSVQRRPGDRRTAEEATRVAFEGAPVIVRVVIRCAWLALGFRLAAPGSEGHIFGWRVVRSEPAVVEIAADGARARSRIVVRDDGGAMVATTFLAWDGRVIGPTWAVLAPVHRRMARYLLDRGAGS